MLILCHSINLWEMAEFLLKQDVVNVINLDGGGSANSSCSTDLGQLPHLLVSPPEPLAEVQGQACSPAVSIQQY